MEENYIDILQKQDRLLSEARDTILDLTKERLSLSEDLRRIRKHVKELIIQIINNSDPDGNMIARWFDEIVGEIERNLIPPKDKAA
ncbi:MAG: hypothetical protein KGZ88_09500 [Methylomicrobium sp.]|nr:hypothetical protein [Methylomicrobium sp.]